MEAPTPDDDVTTGGPGPTNDSGAPSGGKPAGSTGVPPAWSPDSLPPEAQEWLRKQAADAQAKSRVAAKTAAAKEAEQELMRKISEAMGLTDPATDPAQLTTDLAAAREENRRIRIETAIEAAAGRLGADPELVSAWLERRRAADLKAVDPNAETFRTDVEALITSAVEANPRLRMTPAATLPAAAGATDSAGFSSAGTTGTFDPNTASVEDFRAFFGKKS